MEVDSAITTQSRAMVSGSSTTKGQHGETPIVAIPLYKSVRTPWKRTEQAVCGYVRYDPSVNASSTTAISHSFRLNSIIDCYTTSTPLTGDGAPANQVIDANGSVDYPMYRNYWLTFYNYWTVVACEYRVRFNFVSGTFNQGSQLAIYCYHHGRSGPPLDNGGSPAAHIPHYLRAQHPGVSWKFLQSQYANVTTSGGSAVSMVVQNQLNNYVEFQGTWYPGMTPHDVVEDEFQQTWHRGNEMPPTKEMMTFVCQAGPNNTSTTAQLGYRMEAELQYHVQFKDLKQTYAFISQTTAVPAITAADIHTIVTNGNAPA